MGCASDEVVGIVSQDASSSRVLYQGEKLSLMFCQVFRRSLQKYHGVVVGIDDLPLMQEWQDASHRRLAVQEAEADPVLLKERFWIAL